MNVNSLLEGASPLQHQQAESAKLAGKWEKSGLLEGLDGHESEKANMAVLLENQARQLVNEASSTGTGTSITATTGEQWAGVALPLVRRVFGEIVAKDLVSVQPMNLPSGLIFYLDFQYGTAQAGFDQNDSIYGANSTQTKNVLPSLTDPNQGLYNNRFGYSINDKKFNASAAISGAAAFDGILNFDSSFSASILAAGETFGAVDSTYYSVIIPTSEFTNVGADLEGLKAFTVESSQAGQIEGVYPQFTRINGDNVEFVVSGSVTAATMGAVTASYQEGPDNLNDRGDFEDTTFRQVGEDGGVGLDIPEINVKLNSSTVTAKTRKLKAQWTPEFAQDLNAYHSIDAEAELTSILSEYISMEIDLEILDMLIKNADTVNHWSADIAKEVSNTGATVSSDGTGQYYTKMSWFQTLGVKLQAVSNEIHQKTLRGGANFLVVSPKVSTILESIPGFAADSPGDQNKFTMGVQKIGAINSRYTVYKNPYMVENTILMGYKGNQFLETGAVFAPYIPLIMTPLVYDPTTFTPRKGIMTRYAKKMVRPDFYGKVVCHDLNLV